jgi:hypothetical protein
VARDARRRNPLLLGNFDEPSINPDVLQRLQFMMFEVCRNPKLSQLTLPAGLPTSRASPA